MLKALADGETDPAGNKFFKVRVRERGKFSVF
jgi:hypothetical protein